MANVDILRSWQTVKYIWYVSPKTYNDIALWKHFVSNVYDKLVKTHIGKTHRYMNAN